MPWWGTVLLSIGTTIFGALAAIRIKHAPDAASATRELVALVSQILMWAGSAATLVDLVLNVNSAKPVTRTDVALIALQIGVLVFVATASLLRQMVAVMTRHADVTAHLQGVVGDLVRVSNALADRVNAKGDKRVDGS